MTSRHQVGWIPVLSGDSYALRQFIRGSANFPDMHPNNMRAIKELLSRMEEIQDKVEQPRPPSDVWGVAV